MKNERVGELTTYLTALTSAHSAGYKCHGEIGEALRELRTATMGDSKDADYVRYKLEIKREIGNNVLNDRNAYQRMLFTNKTIYNAYANNDADTLELCFGRCSGTSTSINALINAFDDVVYIEYERNRGANVTDKVVFVERDIQLPTGVRPKRVIRIRQFEDGRLY
jgi:hypothetical protein